MCPFVFPPVSLSLEGAEGDVDVYPLALDGVEGVAPCLAVPTGGVVAACRGAHHITHGLNQVTDDRSGRGTA